MAGGEIFTNLPLVMEPPLEIKIVFVFLFVFLTISTIFGNMLVMKAVWKFSNLRTAANVILVSLSAADMLMVVVFILDIAMILTAGHKATPRKLCGVTSVINLALNSIVILHLALIGVERFIAIKFPLRYLSIVTPRRTLIASATVWLWGIGTYSIFPLFKVNDKEAFLEFLRALTPCLDAHSRDDIIPETNPVRDYLIFLLTALLVLPIAMVIASYGYIIKVARKQQTQINAENTASAGNVAMKRELKATRTVSIVVGLCLASYMPLVVMLAIRLVNINSPAVERTKMIGAYLVASLNAVWNPLVYCWRNEDFRRSFKRLLECHE